MYGYTSISAIFVSPVTRRSKAYFLRKLCVKFSGLALFYDNVQTGKIQPFDGILVRKGDNFRDFQLLPWTKSFPKVQSVFVETTANTSKS